MGLKLIKMTNAGKIGANIYCSFLCISKGMKMGFVTFANLDLKDAAGFFKQTIKMSAISF